MTKKAFFSKIASGLVKGALYFVEHPELLQIVRAASKGGK